MATGWWPKIAEILTRPLTIPVPVVRAWTTLAPVWRVVHRLREIVVSLPRLVAHAVFAIAGGRAMPADGWRRFLGAIGLGMGWFILSCASVVLFSSVGRLYSGWGLWLAGAIWAVGLTALFIRIINRLDRTNWRLIPPGWREWLRTPRSLGWPRVVSWLTLIRTSLVTCAGVYIGLMLAGVLSFVTGSALYRREIQVLEREGIRLYAESRRVPDRLNAAFPLSRLGRNRWLSGGDMRKWRGLKGQTLTGFPYHFASKSDAGTLMPTDWKAARQYVRTAKPLLEAIERAVALGDADWYEEYRGPSGSWELKPRHYALPAMARLLRVAAEVSSHDGHPAEAVRWIVCGLRLGRLGARSSGLIQVMTRASADRILLAAAACVESRLGSGRARIAAELSATEVAGTHLASMMNGWNEYYPSPERLATEPLIEGRWTSLWLPAGPGWLPWEYALLLGRRRVPLLSLRQCYASGKLIRQRDAARWHVVGYLGAMSDSYYLSESLLKKTMESAALHEVARASFVVRGLRDRTGRWPTNLGSGYWDPMSGESLRMSRSGTGLLVYSVGRDLSDDHGVPYDRKTEKGDLVWRLSAH